MKTKTGYKFYLDIETITPVSIGTGESLSPLADYWIWGNCANKLDYKKFEKVLDENPEYIPVYLNGVKNHINKAKNDFLYGFIKNTLKDDPRNYISETISVTGNGNATELKTCIKEKEKLIIPASTIKGAIKSAMLYYWLMKDEHDEIMTEILDDLELLYDSTDNKSKRESEKERKIVEKITDLLDQFLEKMSKNKRMNFSLLKIEDAYFENEFPIWIYTLRQPLKYKKHKEKQEEIPIFLEAIPTGSKSSFHIELENNQTSFNTNPNLSEYFKDNGISNLIKHINRYSKDNLRYEKECVKRKNELNGYLNELSSLEKTINQSSENVAFIPLGFGKTNFYQSIGLALWNWINRFRKEDGDDCLNYAFESYLRLFKIGKAIDNEWQNQIPTTRTLTIINQQPLGWVKLTIK